MRVIPLSNRALQPERESNCTAPSGSHVLFVDVHIYMELQSRSGAGEVPQCPPTE